MANEKGKGLWTLMNWSNVNLEDVKSPDDANDEDMRDIHIVEGLVSALGEDMPMPPEPVTPEEQSRWDGHRSARADKAWQRWKSANDSRVSELQQTFDEAHDARRAEHSARLREHTAAFIGAKGEERLAQAALLLGEATDGNFTHRHVGKPPPVRERHADSETKAIRRALGLEGSTDVHFPSWMRQFQADALARFRSAMALWDGNPKKEPKHLFWTLLRKLNTYAAGEERLDRWNKACANVFQRYGLAGRANLTGPSLIDGRAGIGLLVATTESAHVLGSIATPLNRTPIYQPNRSSIIGHLAEAFKADAAAGRLDRHTVCRLTSESLIVEDKRERGKHRTLWRIGDELHGYNRDAVVVLLTAAAGLANVTPEVVVEYDDAQATPEERANMAKALEFSQHPQEFAALAVLTDHPDYKRESRAYLQLPRLESRAEDAWEIEDDHERAKAVRKTQKRVDDARALLSGSRLVAWLDPELAAALEPEDASE